MCDVLQNKNIANICLRSNMLFLQGFGVDAFGRFCVSISLSGVAIAVLKYG